MLSKEQQEALSSNLQAWADKEKVSKDVASMVAEIALSNPDSGEAVKKFCDDHLWSPKLAEFYSKFLLFLRDNNGTKQPATGKDLKERLMELAEELYTIAEGLDA